MPEAEEVITDAARHAAVFVRDPWRRHRKDKPRGTTVALRDVARRIDLLNAAIFGHSLPVRVAQEPPPPTLLIKVFKRGEGPRAAIALPATDGAYIWLPSALDPGDAALAGEWYRLIAIQQAMRARRQAPRRLRLVRPGLQQAVLHLLLARAADLEIEKSLPGLAPALDAFRRSMLAARPPLECFPAYRRPLEAFARDLLSTGCRLPPQTGGEEPVRLALEVADALGRAAPPPKRGALLLYEDLWTGNMLPPSAPETHRAAASEPDLEQDAIRSARMARRPEARESEENEDDDKQGAWMVQTSQPHEQAEDPLGMQRPSDRDRNAAAEEYADALSELPEARLVSTPERPKEILLSEDMPSPRSKRDPARRHAGESARIWYPEWDYRAGGYREPGAAVWIKKPDEGPQAWVNRVREDHRAMLELVRRRFDMLRARRIRLRRQLEGDEIDLEAYIESHADFKAGRSMSARLYQSRRAARRDLSVVLLIDVSGSTDAWISADKRIIDIEREALLLVAIALQEMREPYCIMGFSGEGPTHVTITTLKAFDEACSDHVGRRIAALEPEHYTRAGAALRHASAALLRQPAEQRLLLLLSDGKPNDIDDYEGRYGVEDLRQAVTEARLQGISPFCLTIDRQAAGYLPVVFGPHHYALLPRPELLPSALLEWMRRLLSR